MFITTTDKSEIVDICSDLRNRSRAGDDALAAGGKQYQVELAAVMIGDHYDGEKHTADSPQRAVIAADEIGLAADLATLETAKVAPDATIAALTRVVLRLAGRN